MCLIWLKAGGLWEYRQAAKRPGNAWGAMVVFMEWAAGEDREPTGTPRNDCLSAS